MYNQYHNLPGVYVNKEDGNLSVIESIPGEVTLVLGTAPDGPNSLYLVTDTMAAEYLYDPDGTKEGTLMKGIYEVLESGAKYVAAYRIGATPVMLDFVNGHTIVTKKAYDGAGTEYKLYYNYNTSTSAETIRILDATTGEILFDSAAGIDNGEFLVYGDATLTASNITIGSSSTLASCPSFADLKNFTNSSYNVGSTKTIAFVTDSKTFTTSDNSFKAGQVVELAQTTGTAGDGVYIIDYVTLNSSTYTVTVSKKLTYADGVVTVTNAENWTITGGAEAGTAQHKIKFVAANDGLDLTYNEKFAALQRAYWDLEAANIDMVYPTGVYFNAPNVVDNDGFCKYDETDSPNYVSPTGDFLGKIYEFTFNGQLFFAFKNAFDVNIDTADALPSAYELGIDGFAAKAFATGKLSIEKVLTCTSDAGITTAIAAPDISFNEANFGHQLAVYCDSLSTNSNEASGVIAMVGPKNYSKPAVTTWIGKAPTYDITSGTITRSGTGLLGYKFRVGSRNVSAGLFRTDNGYVDGTPIVDTDNGQVADIGRYVDVIAHPLIVNTSYDGTTSGYLTPGAGVYAGLIMKLDPNIPATGKTVSIKARLPFTLPKVSKDALVGAGYIIYDTNTDGYVKVVDAPTGALSTSDWSRRSTCRVAAVILESIRKIAEKYIGSLTNSNIRLSLQEEIRSLLKRFAEGTSPYILGGNATIKATRAMEIRGEAALKLEIVTASEMRRLTIYTKLSK